MLSRVHRISFLLASALGSGSWDPREARGGRRCLDGPGLPEGPLSCGLGREGQPPSPPGACWRRRKLRRVHREELVQTGWGTEQGPPTEPGTPWDWSLSAGYQGLCEWPASRRRGFAGSDYRSFVVFI